MFLIEKALGDTNHSWGIDKSAGKCIQSDLMFFHEIESPGQLQKKRVEEWSGVGIGTGDCVSCAVKGEALGIKCDMISWLGSGEGTVEDETTNLQCHGDV